MLKKLAISGLTVLTLFIFSSAAYSQYNMALINHYSALPYSEAYATAHMGTMERSAYVSAYNESLPGVGRTTYYSSFDNGPERAHSVYTHTHYKGEMSGEPSFVTYKRYVRPGDAERITSETYLAPMDVPVVSSTSTSIGVPPFGYKYYTKNTKAPIRDFRTDVWETKTYSSASEKNVLYDEMYGSTYVNPEEK
jgi:hypothetical protein